MNNNYIRNREINTNRLRPEYNVQYTEDVVRQNNHVIMGDFPKSNSVRAMAIEKVNKTLCGLLICAIIISAVSYFFVVSSEIELNECSKKTTLLNVENAELQNKLDKLKSFNNVDLTVKKNNLLQPAKEVIEATYVKANNPDTKKTAQKNAKPKAWAIGY